MSCPRCGDEILEPVVGRDAAGIIVAGCITAVYSRMRPGGYAGTVLGGSHRESRTRFLIGTTFSVTSPGPCGTTVLAGGTRVVTPGWMTCGPNA